MIDTEIDYLDGEFQVTETTPTLLSEVIGLIGEDAVINEAVANLRYRNKYPRVYRKVSQAIAGSFPRAVVKTETKKDGTVKNILESEMDHIRAALTGRKDAEGNEVSPGLDNAREVLGTLFSQIGASEPLYVKGERTGGGGKISQAALDSANAILAKGSDAVEAAVAAIEGKVTGYKVGRDADGEVTPEGLARAIQALNKQLLIEAKKGAAALLG